MPPIPQTLAIGWTVHRFWEEELRDYQTVAKRLENEIRKRSIKWKLRLTIKITSQAKRKSGG